MGGEEGDLTAYPAIARGAAKDQLRGRRESLPNRLFEPNWFLDGLVIGICSAPNADRFIVLITNHRVGTAACDHSWRLVGQMLSGVDHFGLQRNLVPNMVAIC